MDKLKKVGLTALAGTFAATSAQALEMSVAGSAGLTMATSDSDEVTGNRFSFGDSLTFSGSGELDNGTTVTLTMTQTDKTAWSGGSIKMATPSMGTINFNHGAAGIGVDRYDDAMPTAWEETTGTGTGTGMQTIAGVGGGGNIEWTAQEGLLPDGVSLNVAFAPKANKHGDTGRSIDPIGVDGERVPGGEVGEYCPFVKP